jgi:hypothetical protein
MERQNAPVAVGELSRPKLRGLDCAPIQGDRPARARCCLAFAELEATIHKVDVAPLQGADRVVRAPVSRASVTKGSKARETERPQGASGVVEVDRGMAGNHSAMKAK